jgi:predicted nucleic acid-binding protein
MVLVDTSVWVRFLAGRQPYATGLDELLTRDEVVGHEMVFGELLIGDRGGRVKLLGSYVQMQQSNTIPHNEVVEFVRERRLFGRGVGWIDLHLLASAVVGQLELWTADRQFAAVAAELRISFDAASS